MITQLNAAASSETVLTRKWSCLWRPDVGSSLYARTSWQKAGGVGGLAWLQTGAAQTLATDNLFSLQGTCEIHIPMGDHMGNIRNYIHARATTVNDGSGPYAMVNFTPSANFEYDAFGREVRANGTTVAATNTPPGLTAGTSYADALPFHYSSKFTDPESGLNYYGYRFYDAKDGRWLSRDPIAERGGANIYGFVENNPNNQYDIDGRFFNIIGGLVSVGLGYGISVVSGQDYSIGEGLVDFAFGAAGPGLIGKVKDAYKACKAVKYEAKYVQVIIKSQTRAFDPITGANLGTHLEKSVAREWSLRVTAGEVLWETSGLAVYHTGKYFVKDHIKNDTQTIDKLDAVIEHTVHPNGETKTNYKISTEKSENPIGAEKDTGGSIDLNRPLD